MTRFSRASGGKSAANSKAAPSGESPAVQRKAAAASAVFAALLTGCEYPIEDAGAAGRKTSGDVSDSSAVTITRDGRVGKSCVTNSPSHLCLAIHFVSYQDPTTGKAVAPPAQALA